MNVYICILIGPVKFISVIVYLQVGTYTVTTGFLNLDPTQLLAFTSVTSQCPSPCAACNYMYPLQPHFVVDGDIMLGMLVDIHLEGDDPFTCGDLKFGRGFLFTEALRYALDRVNTGNSCIINDICSMQVVRLCYPRGKPRHSKENVPSVFKLTRFSWNNYFWVVWNRW